MKLNDETNNAAIASKERKKKYTCYVCMTKFFTASDLDKHKSQHNDENDADLVTKDDDKDSDYSGNESEESESDQDYDLTKKISVPSIENTNPTTCNLFNCFTCKVVFRSLSDLRTHPSRECIFSCKLCARNLDNADVFLCHIIYHKINFFSLRFFKCAVCSLFFKSYFQLRKHESVSHNLKPWAGSGKLPPLPDSDSKETVEPCIVPKEEPPDQDLSEARGSTTAIACELCFDLCNSDEEFFTHMEFHRQLTIKDSEDSEIINNEFNTPNSKVAKFATSTPTSRPKIKIIRNLPKPEKSKLPVSFPKSNPSGANDSTSKRCTVNKQDVLKMTNAPFPYKIQISSRDSDEGSRKVINSSDQTLKVASKSPNVAFRQLDPTTLTKRLVLRKELRPSGKWCLSKNDSAKVKDYFNSKIQEVKSKKNKNVEKNCFVFATTANDVTRTASKVVVRNSGVSTSSAISTIKSYPQKGQRVLKKILPSQVIVKTANTTTTKSSKLPRQNIPTSKSNTPKAVVRNKKIPVPRVNTVKGMQTTLPPSTNIAPTLPNVVIVPPTPNSYISVPLDEQDPNSEQPNNWTNSSNTNVANSNLIYVINPVNNLGMPSEPQLAYINDTSSFTFFFMPSNTAENVANANFSPQTSAIQNTYSVQEANKVVYALPSVDQSLNLVPQNDNSQLSNPVGMPLLSSDNLIFITNQPSSSNQTSMQTSGMINTIVSQNSLQPSGPSDGYFPQS